MPELDFFNTSSNRYVKEAIQLRNFLASELLDRGWEVPGQAGRFAGSGDEGGVATLTGNWVWKTGVIEPVELQLLSVQDFSSDLQFRPNFEDWHWAVYSTIWPHSGSASMTSITMRDSAVSYILPHPCSYWILLSYQKESLM